MLKQSMRSLIMGMAVVAAGCTAAQAPAPAPAPVAVPPPAVTYIEHTIKYSGETLALIAAWYTGKATNWTAIQEANPGLKPEYLRLGQVIRIPEQLVVKREELPKSYVKVAPAVEPLKQESAVVVEGAALGATEAASSQPAAPEVQKPVLEQVVPAAPSEAPSALSGTAPAVAPAAAAAGKNVKPVENTDDQERERLLDELLK